MPSLLPPASEFASIASEALRTIGAALEQLRNQAVDQLSFRPSLPEAPDAAARLSSSGDPVAGLNQADLGKAQHLLNSAAMANKRFEINSSVPAIGMLNLERVEMAPAGIERGELIATIPLAPGEKTSVVQKEWSVTTKEFTSIVTDSLENVSETGVTDNTELTQSATSQIQHANQFNITGTVSGGIPLISGSATSSFGVQDSSSQSAAVSRKHAVSVTQKASSRTKQEHKVTISTSTVAGTAETTTRELVNPSRTHPIRIDYFSMMRKWRVRLYRYGLRLTYDIVIPSPAGALRQAYAALANLRSQLVPFTFNVPLDEITPDTYKNLVLRYGAQVPPPPGPEIKKSIGGVVEGLSNDDKDEQWHFSHVDFDVIDGYVVSAVSIDAMLSNVTKERKLAVFGIRKPLDLSANQPRQTQNLTVLLYDWFLYGCTGHQTINYFLQYCGLADVTFTITMAPSEQTKEQWKANVWNALYNAAQTQYYAQQQDVAAQISQIEDRLNSVDTLTLRREESDEIMKGVLRFLLGPDFDFMPKDVKDAIAKSGTDIVHGVAFTGNELGLSAYDWTTVLQYQDEVRFVNQAIEWENVVSFLYSYFWDLPDSWDFIRQIKHPDANRQAFLRAGSARIVLTVRKGFEEDWIKFVEGGFRGDSIDSNHPYLTIAREIAAYDDRNYPGIPPANPDSSAIRLEDAVYTTSTASLIASSDPVEIEVDSSAGFLIGAQVVIDQRVDTDETSDVGRQEAQIIIKISDVTHITVAKLAFPHGGDGIVFSIVQPGDKGALIAEWNEYTPTSGTDIAVTSDLPTIA